MLRTAIIAGFVSAIVANSALGQVALPTPADASKSRNVRGVFTPSALHGSPPTEMHARDNASVNGLPHLNTQVPASVGIIGNSPLQ